MLRKVAATVVLVATALALTACTGIPYSGGVNKGAAATTVPDTDIQFLPAGPRKDATPEEILRGFVDAATSPAGNWAIAREFLTADFSRQWVPSKATYIDEGARLVIPSGVDSLRLTTTVTSTVDDLGVYSGNSGTNVPDLSYSFVQVGGQWRISQGPAGVVIDRATFPKVYAQNTLFFYNSDFTGLIPDVRWFPSRSSESTRVVKALLAGPSDWLSTSGAAVSAIPVGAALMADSVPVDGGVASINFNSQTVKAKEGLSMLILRQLAASMVGIPAVRSVTLSYSGSPQGEAPVPSRDALLAPTGYDSAVVVREGVLAALENKGAAPLVGLSATVIGLSPTAVSLNSDRSLAVVNSQTGLYTVLNNRKPVLVDTRATLIPASIDAQDFVWSVPAGSPRELRITGRAGTARTLRVPWTAAKKISFLSVEPDGTRVVAGYSTGQGTRLCVAGVARGDDRWPKSIGQCEFLPVPEGTLLSAAWIDATRVGVLASAKTVTLRLATVGGLFQDSAAPVGAVSLAGSGALLAPRLLTNYGELYLQQALNRWSVVSDKVSLLATTQ